MVRPVVSAACPRGTFLRSMPRKLPAVKAAVSAISWRVAALPLTAYAVDSGDDETPIDDDETNLVTRRWSAFATRIEGCQRMLASALLHGHGAVYVAAPFTERPAGVFPAAGPHPDRSGFAGTARFHVSLCRRRVAGPKERAEGRPVLGSRLSLPTRRRDGSAVR